MIIGEENKNQKQNKSANPQTTEKLYSPTSG
jgi:hypothetical protein